MEKLTKRLLPTGGGLIHDTRKDAKTLMKAVNMLIDKVNELIDENNRLKKMIEEQDPIFLPKRWPPL